MNQKLFLQILYLTALAKIPLSYFLRALKFIFPFIESRMDFESKNITDIYCRSFHKLGLQADFCFEVSSEGEFEQVMPLLERFIKENKRIELIFASPSVEKKCLTLAQAYTEQIRVLRFPILTGSIFSLTGFQNLNDWVTAPLICLCRYDFYPELLLLCNKRRSILLAASSKRHNFFKKSVYQLFNLIVCSNQKEESFFTQLQLKATVLSFDFRILRIFSRLESKEIVLCKHQGLQYFLNYLKNQNGIPKVIIGSAWCSDFIHLDNDFIEMVRLKKAFLMIVPHDLKSGSILDMKQFLANRFPGICVYEINSLQSQFDQSVFSQEPGIVLLNMSGVLCELYSQFNYAYVGGGHEFSIHSVLEPFLAGAKVLTSGNVSRSTEYDFIKEQAPDEICLLNNDQSFYNFFMNNKFSTTKDVVRSQIIQRGQDVFNLIVREFYL